MITIIASTNRADSKTYLLSSYYKKKMEALGQSVRLLSLDQLPNNFIVSDLYGKRSEEFTPIQELISQTQKFIFIIPEYNGSFPGILKLFIDACTFPVSFKGKKAALVGLSNGKYGNIRGVEHFTGVCNYIGLTVLPLRIHIPYIQQELNAEQELFKDDTVKFTNQQMTEFLQF